ncbi:MAG: hypothetical protein J6D02_02370 [Lachnospira sp.]|nr:hypothetical protein [Lachnospira sp.]
MKKIILMLLLGIMIPQCLAGCGVTTEKTGMNNTTQMHGTAEEQKGDEKPSKDLLAKVYDEYYYEVPVYSKAEMEEGLDNDCVAIKDIFAEDYPEIIALSPYYFSKKGYIDEAEFTIKTYRELAEGNTKILYADYEFIQSNEKVKGYAILLKKDGTIVLHTYSDDFSKYVLLEKDGEDRFLACRTIEMEKSRFLIDDKEVSKAAADDNVTILLNNLDCILIKDGVVSEETEQAVKNLSSEQLNPHDAEVMCMSKYAEYASDEIDKNKMWSEFSGFYSSDCGVKEAKMELTIESDGSFVGEYKGMPEKVDKTVDGKHAKERMDYAKFHGTFSNARKLNDIEYYVECNDFSYVNTKEDEVKDGVLYHCCEPNPLKTFTQFIIYKKGSKLEDVPEDISWWYEIFSFYQEKEVPDKLDRHVIRNMYTNSFVYQQEKTE